MFIKEYIKHQRIDIAYSSYSSGRKIDWLKSKGDTNKAIKKCDVGDLEQQIALASLVLTHASTFKQSRHAPEECVEAIVSCVALSSSSHPRN